MSQCGSFHYSLREKCDRDEGSLRLGFQCCDSLGLALLLLFLWVGGGGVASRGQCWSANRFLGYIGTSMYVILLGFATMMLLV